MKLPLLFSTCAVLLLAADPPWKAKPVADWTVEDARQILTDSPWAKNVTAMLTRRLNAPRSEPARSGRYIRGFGGD